MCAVLAFDHALTIDEYESSCTTWCAFTIPENLVAVANALAPSVLKPFAIVTDRHATITVHTCSGLTDWHTRITFNPLVLIAKRNTSTSVVTLVHAANGLAIIAPRLVALLAVRDTAVTVDNEAIRAVRYTITIDRLEALITNGDTAVLCLGKTSWAIGASRWRQYDVSDTYGQFVERIGHEVVH